LAESFSWQDGERLIRFGRGALDEAPALLAARGLEPYALLTTARAAPSGPDLAAGAAAVLHVPPGAVPEAAAAVRAEVGGRAIVALGGGRVIDAAKAIGGADGLPVAAVPTTLSGAPMTRFHRMPAGVERFALVRPALVVVEPSLMASQPLPGLAASAMNALAHAIEALYGPGRSPVTSIAARRAIELFLAALVDEEPPRDELALASVLAGYAVGCAGFAVHHAICQTTVRLLRTPHAETNAVMLPHSVRFVAARAPAAVEGVDADAVARVAARAGVTSLTELGVDAGRLDEIVAAVLEHPASGNTPNGRPSAAEIRALLGAAL
jgi:alcohol dehydrogenase class IV